MPKESSNRKWFHYFDDLPIGIMITDQNYKIVHWNYFLEKKSGTSCASLIDQSLFDAFPYLSDIRYKNRMDNVLQGGAPAHFSSLLNKHFIPIKMSDGRLATVSTTVKLIEDPQQENSYLLFSIQDLSEVERRNEEIKKVRKKSYEDVKESNEALEYFSYTVAHDLKTPLRGISLYSDIIREELEESMPEAVDQALGKIDMFLDKTYLLLRDLLEYSRVGRVGVDFEPIDMNQILNDLNEELSIEFSKNNVEFERPNEWPVLIGNAVYIGQIFQNLILNAINYNSKKSKKIKILFEEQDHVFKFGVQDNGDGIEETYRDQVFDMFFKKNKKDQESSGAGLALVKKMVELHQGQVSLETEVGEGSTFYFTLKKDC